jgi:hypothetical protein
MSNTILNEIYDYVGRFVLFPDDASRVAHTLWIAHTYFIGSDAIYTTPRLLILSPERRCGKTRLLELTALLVKNQSVLYDPTPSALFTSIELQKPTLLIDEVDSIYADKKESGSITGIINAGFQHGGIVSRVEMVPERHIAKFNVFAPMLLAGIDRSSIPDTVEDRSIIITLQRKPKSDIRKFRPRREKHIMDDLRKRLEQWATSTIVQSKLNSMTDPMFPDGMNDREEDKWESLFIVADIADVTDVSGVSERVWSKLVREAAVKSTKKQAGWEKASDNEMILSHVRKVFEALGQDIIQTSILLMRWKMHHGQRTS